MRDWNIGINSHAEWRLGHVEVVEWPWWLALADWFAGWIDWRWLHRIPLPDWPQAQWNLCDEGETYSPKEYWGDVGGLVFAYVCNPLYQWVYRHPRRKGITVEIGYDRTRELFGEMFNDFFAEHERLDQEDEPCDDQE
jgi:hypothetical protein